MLRILFLFAVLAAALAEDAEAQKHGAKLLEHTFGSVSAVPSGTAVSDLKLVTGDAGMQRPSPRHGLLGEQLQSRHCLLRAVNRRRPMPEDWYQC